MRESIVCGCVYICSPRNQSLPDHLLKRHAALSFG